MNSEKEHEKKIVVGQHVKLSCEGEKDEYGIVIYTWRNPEIGMMKDCYVAFWGNEIPDFDSEEMISPYILRYAAASLQPI
ncbi:MAG: hypothetical protein AB2786_06070 [Candidatus Thiodiazotropha endolucinida]